MKRLIILALGGLLALSFPGGAPAQPDKGAEKKSSAAGFVLRSPAVEDGGQLPVEYTGDGASATLPLEWSGAPKAAKSFALIMHHIAPDKTKWYWIIYDIPAKTRKLPKNVKGVGILGNNSVNGRVGYAPPHSKGPGPKKYIYTVYALSAAPRITVKPEKVNRETLLSAMKGLILGSAGFSVIYERFTEPDSDGADGPPPPPPGEGQ
ncbi:MAG: YbhB/YbcL family Raf kinase inhibitor-like protein [Elusimicrobiota bacterium]